jgi:PHD/YefM family antitoxin component YafN of YafNO toxin-antitoxin module
MKNQNIADSVIKILFEVGIGGETMEYIINKMGMRNQMIKQLTYQDDIVDDKDDKVVLKRGKEVAVSFSQQELIQFTREIQSRALEAAVSAIESSGVDMESHVSLELNYGNQIDIEVDDDSIYSVIVDNVRDVFETDDDSIEDEIDNVIDHLFKRF